MQQDIDKAWGRLLSSNTKEIPSFILYQHKITIGGLSKNQVYIANPPIGLKHCLLEYRQGQCYVTDKYDNGVVIDRFKINSGRRVLLRNGQKLELQEKSRQQNNETYTQRQQTKGRVIFTYVQLIPYQSPKHPFTTTDKQKYHDEFICPICQYIMYQPVSLIPCLHSFCGECLKKWRNQNNSCPTCREQTQQAKPNTLLQSVIALYLWDNPAIQKDQEVFQRCFINHQASQKRPIGLQKVLDSLHEFLQLGPNVQVSLMEYLHLNLIQNHNENDENEQSQFIQQ